ncbi:5-oxoprolinase subunit PxpB [Clostridium sp. DJ247]|uniref:5-oxoprolinase subunit PxpB n=1 Tax=Clostridium sp. DJ247 TaxID=2726188 RepID=UPI001629E885|nr:5-oxoprolinase subunit PxpB [Clostridium sp. DJ247]MBC2581095.1 5-oxoprolinase subunit PxpB [Clostridium sp. DJ247]
MFPLGESAIVVEFGKKIHPEIHKKVKVLTDYLHANPFPGMIEAVSAFSSVTVFYDVIKVKGLQANYIEKHELSYKIVVSLLQQVLSKLDQSLYNERRAVEIPVCYGGELGPDLEYVAEYNKLTVDEVVKIHSSREYLVYMIGFAPGFPYLGGMSEQISTPRRQCPRMLIPKGAVGIAGMQTGVYPISTPGGWQLIGSTPLELFRANEYPPSLLQAGDIVRFRPISHEEYKEEYL